jgi:hypothetical protein
VTTFRPPTCMWCTHYKGDRKCDAFPGGIPALVWEGRDPHFEPIEGDRGIQFEPSDQPVGTTPE